jgi:Endomembrane protein 70
MLLIFPFLLQTRSSQIDIFYTKAFPLNSPSETYKASTILPLCPVANPKKSPWFHPLSRVLDGERLEGTPFVIQLRKDISSPQIFCEKKLSLVESNLIPHLSKENFIISIEVDRYLPVLFEPFKSENGNTFIFKNLVFDFGVNVNKIVAVNVTVSEWQSVISTGSNMGTDTMNQLTFSYHAKFVDSEISKWNARSIQETVQLSRVNAPALKLSKEAELLGIANASILIFLSFSLIIFILIRTVRTDLLKADMEMSQIIPSDVESQGIFDELSGWKLLHGDVFRTPTNRMVFTALIGVGFQLFVMTILTMTATFALNLDTSASAAVVSYMISAFSAGFESTKWYTRLGGEKWAWNVIAVATVFAVPLFGIFCTLNTVAWMYHSTAAIPISNILFIGGSWLVLTFPLTILGGVAGRKHALKTAPYWPSKTNKLAREIPPSPVYLKSWLQYLICGFLPFSAIYVELLYVLDYFWGVGQSHMHALGFLVVAGLLTLILSASLNVLFTYFQIQHENHRWHWRCFLSGASLGVFVFGYSVFDFYVKSEMEGFLQFTFFVLYSLVMSAVIGLICGYFSWMCSLRFIAYIYSQVKFD